MLLAAVLAMYNPAAGMCHSSFVLIREVHEGNKSTVNMITSNCNIGPGCSCTSCEMLRRDQPREALGVARTAASPSLLEGMMMEESGGEFGEGREAARVTIGVEAGTAPSAITNRSVTNSGSTTAPGDCVCSSQSHPQSSILQRLQ